MNAAAATPPSSTSQANEPRPVRQALAPEENAEAMRDRFAQVMARRMPSCREEEPARQALSDAMAEDRAPLGEESAETPHGMPAEPPIKIARSAAKTERQGDRTTEIAASHNGQTQQAGSSPTQASRPAAAPAPAMDAALLAQFAERLALAEIRPGQTTLTLDTNHFRIAEATIEGRTAEGLSITLKDRSGAGNDDQSSEDGSPLQALRARLQARAIPVTSLEREG